MTNQALKGKTALVTGASSGIGAASASALAADGAAVLLMGRGEPALAKTRADILAKVPGARIEIFTGNAREEADVKAAVKRAHDIAGRLDILMPTIGGTYFKPVLMQSAAEFLDEYQWNVGSVFLAVRHGVPLMDHGGSIICLSSASVNQPLKGLAAYVSAKAGLERFVRAAAHELASAKVRINAVRVGLTRSAGSAMIFELPELLKRFESEIPFGRAGEPDDIAKVVRFLAGPESDWVTGQTLSADGGQDQGKAPEMLDDLYGKDVMDKIRAGKPPA